MSEEVRDEAATWVVHPARQRPLVAVAVVLAISAASAFASAGLGGSTGLALVLAAALIGSVSTFFFPTRYELDATGVTIKHLGTRRTRSFDAVRRIELDRATALLSPFRAPRRLDRFRALTLMLDGAPPHARLRLESRRAELAQRS